MMRPLVLAITSAAIASSGASCGHPSAVPGVRFANAPPVTAVNDRQDVPKPPAVRATLLDLYYFDGAFLRLVTRPLELRRHQRARGVNSLDEVPDSTWFTNRIGVREMSPAELQRGPAVVGSPEPHKPWVVTSMKDGGRSKGLHILDARGEAYLLKFEVPAYPEAETAADAITSRILWACGFNVPEDHVVYVRRDELVLASDATYRDVYGRPRRLALADLERSLARVSVSPDGSLRATASRIVPGTPLGGHPGEGVRGDDPNDRIPHELRRDLRGRYAIWAWLDHVDVKEHNTLDLWTTDRGDPGRHYVEHYELDFGKSLGTMALDHRSRRNGHSYMVDYGEILASFATAGLFERSWEHRTTTGLRGVGMYDVRTFDPGSWKPNTQVYVPFRTADRFDKFWGAKIAMRFTRPQLQAIVETGRLTDPRAATYLVDTLVARQRATARYWFDRVAPLDRLVATEDRVCFDDLALTYQLAPSVTTRYTVTQLDRAGRASGRSMTVLPVAARTCLPVHVVDYTMLRIEVARPGVRTAAIVHLANDPVAHAPRVIGLYRL